MDGEVTLKEQNNSTQIGYCDYKPIRRSQMRHIFYDTMEEPSCETSSLAFDIFDRYGRLRKEFKTHPIKRGTGLWQHEFDDGDLLLFEELKIDRRYRRRGLSKRLVTAVLEKTCGKSKSFFAVVQPGYLTRGVAIEIEESMSDEEKAVIYCDDCFVNSEREMIFGVHSVGSSGALNSL
jgi:GNAT superfamily N-acetyltransferase